MPYRNKANDSGFTLVELAIVMVVIGLLIGGIIMGMNVVRNAQLSSAYTKSQIFARAINEFVAQYDALPGDMEFATARLNDCNAPCINGDGNGVIGNPAQPIFAAVTAGDESTLTWYHLQAAGLINDINPGSPLAGGWGQSLPRNDADGGYHLRAMSGVNTDLPGDQLKGLWLRWQLLPFIAANTANAFVVSPHDARKIDDKFDDGVPLDGTVRARGTGAGIGGDGCSAAGGTAYQSNVTTISCYMYFKIRDAVGL